MPNPLHLENQEHQTRHQHGDRGLRHDPQDGMEIAAKLEESWRIHRGYSLHTVKPLDMEGLAKILKKYRRVVVLEEMSPMARSARK